MTHVETEGKPIVHFQVGTAPHANLCGMEKGTNRCLTDCDHCEGSRDAVNCPACLYLASQIFGNLEYFFREGGPHWDGGSHE